MSMKKGMGSPETRGRDIGDVEQVLERTPSVKDEQELIREVFRSERGR